jgi:hypothetical protein
LTYMSFNITLITKQLFIFKTKNVLKNTETSQ